MAEFRNIDEFHSDILKEIGNIGSSSAANSLSIMLDADVGVSIPKVQLLDVNEATSLLGGMENIVVGLFSEVKGDINGLIMLVINLELADKFIKHFINEETTKDGNFNPMQLSTLAEVGNIISSSYANSISALLQLSITLSVPKLCVDMVGAVLSIPSIQMGTVSENIVFIENHFKDKTIDAGAEVFLIPDVPSYDKIMKSIGLE